VILPADTVILAAESVIPAADTRPFTGGGRAVILAGWTRAGRI
jgi:hypothetical protein